MLPSLGGRGRNGVGMVNLSETWRPSVTQSQALPRVFVLPRSRTVSLHFGPTVRGLGR